MSKKSLDEKNNDYISYKSSKIAFCKDGRILLTGKDTDLVGLRVCENCKKKDARIAELETNLRETLDMVKNSNYKEVLEENVSLGNSLKISAELNKKHKERIAELEKQVKIKEIAFLNEIPYWDYYYDWEKFETDKERQLYIKKILEQAEESLKNVDGK